MECKICGKSKPVIHTIMGVFEDEGQFSICDSCWDVIANVAIRMIEVQFPELKPMYKRIEEDA